MSVLVTDIKYYYTGTGTQSNPGGSLGGDITGIEVGASLNHLFDNVSPAEASGGDTEYRAISVKNTNAGDTLYDAFIWITLETVSADTTIAIGYDSAGTQSVVNENTAPSAPVITFSTPLAKVTGISLGDMIAGAVRRIWVRRTVTPGAVKGADNGTLIVEGGTI